MSELSESGSSSSRQNPLIWIALGVVILIIFVFLGGDRGKSTVETDAASDSEAAGTINRSGLIPPGMRARQYIEQLREEGYPYPLEIVFEKANRYSEDGSLADAHLLYFFAARESHIPAMMKMAEMSDPTLFKAENSLLDHADVIQSYKWYQKAAEMGHPAATNQLAALQQWAISESRFGNADARQLLLNFK